MQYSVLILQRGRYHSFSLSYAHAIYARPNLRRNTKGIYRLCSNSNLQRNRTRTRRSSQFKPPPYYAQAFLQPQGMSNKNYKYIVEDLLKSERSRTLYPFSCYSFYCSSTSLGVQQMVPLFLSPSETPQSQTCPLPSRHACVPIHVRSGTLSGAVSEPSFSVPGLVSIRTSHHQTRRGGDHSFGVSSS